MLVLNLLNKIFGKKGDLSRKEIDDYIKKREELNKIERKSIDDAFNSDALEGFSSQNLDTSSMQDLNRKMQSKFSDRGSYSVLYIAASILIIVGVLSYFQFFQPTSSQYQIASTDLDKKEVINDEIEEELFQKEALKEQEKEASSVEADVEAKMAAPEEEQMVTDEQLFQEQEESQEQSMSAADVFTNDDAPAVNLSPLARDEAGRSRKKSPSSLSFKEAKEIYYHDLKLVDYRHYRDAKDEKRAELSGTPAVFESEVDNEAVLDDFDESTVTYAEFIEETMRYISIQKYAIALDRCKQILATYPDDVNANFYAGLSSYELKNYRDAISYFQSSYTIKFGNFRQEARFLMAKSYLALNEKSKAEKILKSIIEEKGYYEEEARKLME